MTGRTRSASFHVDRKQLRDAIRLALRFIPMHNPKTMTYQGTWLEVANGSLTVAGTNGAMSVERSIPVHHADGTADAVVPGRYLTRLLEQIHTTRVSISIDDEAVHVAAGRFDGSVRQFAWPDLRRPQPPVHPRFTATVPSHAFAQGFRHAAMALGSRYAWRTSLAGLEIRPSERSVRFAATDMWQVAIADIEVTGGAIPRSEEGASMLVPKEAMNELARTIPLDEELTVAVGSHQIDLLTPSLVIRTRLEPGPYPDYSEIVGAVPTRRVTADRFAFLRTLRRVGLMAHAESDIWCRFSGGESEIRVQEQLRGEAVDRCDAELTGEPFQIGFRTWSLFGALQGLVGKHMVMAIGDDPTKAVALHTTARPHCAYHLLPLATTPPRPQIALNF